MKNLFHQYLYQPILDALIFIYHNLAFEDLGFAIILLTLAVRIILFPLFYKSARDQSLMQKIQPQVKKLQEDHKENKEAQARALMELYREHKLNPFAGFFMLLLQLPIFIALYRVFTSGLGDGAFSNKTFFGFIDLGVKSLALAAIAALLQYLQGKISLPKQNPEDKGKKTDMASSMARSMLYMGPAFAFFILMNLPAAIGLYWATSTLFSLGQQLYINKKLKNHGTSIETNK